MVRKTEENIYICDMATDKNTTSTNSQNGQTKSPNQGTTRWPSINTSTSKDMLRLRISKSKEFERIIRNHPKD